MVEGGARVSAVDLQKEEPRFESWLGQFAHGVCTFSMNIHGFPSGTPAFFYGPETVQLG